MQRSATIGVTTAAGVLVAALALWPGAPAPATSPAADRPAPAATGADTPDRAAPAAPSVAPRAASAASAAASSPLDALTEQERAELSQALAQHPQRDAEMARIAAYLGFMRKAQRFQALRDAARAAPPGDAEAAELKALAQQLQDEADTHLARGEMTAAEALQLRSATEEVLTPDAGARQQALLAWRQGWATAQAARRTPDAREAEFQRRQQALVAAWSALPEAQRDARALEAQLEALRLTWFPPAR